MISAKCDINEFLEEIKDEDYFDIIWIADKEATEAERSVLRSGDAIENEKLRGNGYASDLKDLIFFLKYAVTSKKNSDRFGQLKENWF
jgi:hypothetical protein